MAPDVYQYLIGGTDPRKVFESSDRRATASPIAVSGKHVAVVETDAEAEPGAWRLWYVAEPGTDPVLVDKSDGADGVQGPYPFIALDGDRLVWTAFHQRAEGPRSELSMASLPSTKPEIIDSQPLNRFEHWFPALDGDHLVYGSIETSATSIKRHVYLRDLGAPATKPRQLDVTGNASMPDISGDNVVWKESPDNVLERGTLMLYSLASRVARPIAFGDEAMVNNPSLDDRFLAADVIDPTRLFLYDLIADKAVKLKEFPAAGREVYVRPHVAGGLITWAHSPAAEGSELILEWAPLPEKR